MLGKDHFLLSFLTVSVVALPLLLMPDYGAIFILILVAASIGSLAPDVDSQDAAIFHSEIRGLHGNWKTLGNFIGPILPVFGVILKYLIYKPSVIGMQLLARKDRFKTQYKVTEAHRRIMHSLLGLLLSFLFLNLYGILLMLAWPALLLSKNIILIFTLAFSVGFFLHLVEDSCTISGVNFTFPFSQRLFFKGNISTGKRSKKTEIFTGLLVVLNIGHFIAPSIMPIYEIQMTAFKLGYIVVSAVLFSWFMFINFSKT